MIRDVLRFLWKRDSNSAVIVLIVISEFMTQRDLLQCRDYLESLHEARKPRGVS